MSDLLERLRTPTIGWSGDAAAVDPETAEEAAAEIEMLMAVMEKARNEAFNGWTGTATKTLDDALRAYQQSQNKDA